MYFSTDPSLRMSLLLGARAPHLCSRVAVIARTLAGLGHVLAATGKHEEAQELTARALALAEGLAEGQLTAELLERVLDAAEVMQSMGDFVQVGAVPPLCAARTCSATSACSRRLSY